MDMLEDFSLDRNSFSFERTQFIEKVIKNTTGYVKIGESVQSHATVDNDTYTLFGGTEEHKQLFSEFLDDHTKWTNLGMNYTAFHKCEKAVLFNPEPMLFEVWVPV